MNLRKNWRRAGLPVLVAALAVAASGCGGKDPSGACVRGSGILATCGDDFSAAQCEFIGGDSWYEGRSCADLGFTPNKDASRVVIAGVARDEAGGLARVTLLNAGPEPLDLRGFRLEIAGNGEAAESLSLAGVIDACGTRDVALAGAREIASPRTDAVLSVVLRGPAAAAPGDRPLSAVLCGEGAATALAGRDLPGASRLGRLGAGQAAVRAAWPADIWSLAAAAAPAAPPAVVGCGDGGTIPDAWRPLVAAYR